MAVLGGQTPPYSIIPEVPVSKLFPIHVREASQEGFWRILETKMEPCWHPKGTQDGSYLKSTENSKNHKKTNRISLILKVRGVQVGRQNRSKIDPKRRSTWEGILASFFDRFWWILGSKLGSKIDQKSIQEGIEKTMRK